MIEFQDRLLQNLGKYAPKAALGILGIAASVFASGRDEKIYAQVSKTIEPNSDGHFLALNFEDLMAIRASVSNQTDVCAAWYSFIDPVTGIEVRNPCLNTPTPSPVSTPRSGSAEGRTIDLQGPPNPYRFIDDAGQQREFSFNNWTDGYSRFGNPIDRVAGTRIDVTRNVIDQVRYSLYPETIGTNSGTNVLIGGITVDISTGKEYWAIVLRFGDINGDYYRIHVEAVNNYNNPSAGHFRFPSRSLPEGYSVGDKTKSIEIKSDSRCEGQKSLELRTRNFEIESNNRLHSICLNQTGGAAESEWRILSSPTATATRTSTTTVTPTRTATATVSPTTEISALGRNFGITTDQVFTGVKASWMPGSGDVRSVIARFSQEGVTILPRTGPLPATVSIYEDNETIVSPFRCYTLVLVSPTGILGNSDVLCAFPNTRTGISATEYSIRLNQSDTAYLSWKNPILPQGANVVVPLGREPIVLSGTANSAQIDTRGAFSCITLASVTGNRANGNTDILCGLPRAFNLPR